MNRRGFLGALGAMLGGVVLEQVIPLNRVWSFPAEIKPVRLTIEKYADYMSLSDLTAVWYDRKAVDTMKSMFQFNELVTGRNLPVSGEVLRLFQYETN